MPILKCWRRGALLNVYHAWVDDKQDGTHIGVEFQCRGCLCHVHIKFLTCHIIEEQLVRHRTELEFQTNLYRFVTVFHCRLDAFTLMDALRHHLPFLVSIHINLLEGFAESLAQQFQTAIEQVGLA